VPCLLRPRLEDREISWGRSGLSCRGVDRSQDALLVTDWCFPAWSNAASGTSGSTP